MKVFLSQSAAKTFTQGIMGGEPHYLYTSTDQNTVFGCHGYTLSHRKGEPYIITDPNGETTEFIIQPIELTEASKELIRTLLMQQSYVCNDVTRPLVIKTLTELNRIFLLLDSKVFGESYDI